jgi:hypothetical protein
MENEIEKSDSEIEQVDPLAVAMQAEFDAMIATQPNESGMEWLPSWYTKKLGELAADEVMLDAQYRKLKSQIAKAQQFLSDRWEGLLRAEIDKQFADGKAGKKKSIDNMYGKIGYREVKGRESVEITDEQAAIDYCRYNVPNAIKTVTTLSKTELKTHITETGEIIPGVEIKMSETYQNFYVTPNTPALERK